MNNPQPLSVTDQQQPWLYLYLHLSLYLCVNVVHLPNSKIIKSSASRCYWPAAALTGGSGTGFWFWLILDTLKLGLHYLDTLGLCLQTVLYNLVKIVCSLSNPFLIWSFKLFFWPGVGGQPGLLGLRIQTLRRWHLISLRSIQLISAFTIIVFVPNTHLSFVFYVLCLADTVTDTDSFWKFPILLMQAGFMFVGSFDASLTVFTFIVFTFTVFTFAFTLIQNLYYRCKLVSSLWAALMRALRGWSMVPLPFSIARELWG